MFVMYIIPKQVTGVFRDLRLTLIPILTIINQFVKKGSNPWKPN